MQRKATRYEVRFENLLAKDYINRYDREFILSLYSYYKQKRSLTSGRRSHFLRLESKYAKKPEVSDEIKSMIELVNGLIERSDLFEDVRGRQILEDFVAQMNSGSKLSQNQKELVDSKIEMYSEENLILAKDWRNSWNDDEKEKFSVAVSYYSSNGYFRTITRKARKDPDYIPTFKEYKAITSNKFIKKIFAGYYSDAKFKTGQQVTWSANARSAPAAVRYCKCKPGSYFSNFGTTFIILETQPIPPLSACKGNKVYKVLSVQTSKVFCVEEREIKNFKMKKKGK